jgi:tetratricopeptide (TPR) repeat protein
MQAADFSQAQHVYVPATVYERRIDSPADSGMGPASDEPTFKTGIKVNKNANNSTSHSYGQIPAPPAVTGSSGGSVVPPPPPYPASLSKAAHDFHAQIKQAAASPTVQAAYLQLKQQAEDYVRSGKLNEAKHAVAQALKLTPHDKALIRELGAISVQRAHDFMQSGDYTQAIQFARQALAFDTTSKDAHSVLNGLLQKEGINASDPAARLKQAELLASQGRNDEAWVEYQASNGLKPSAEAEVGMGNIALRLGRKDLARTEYEQAMQTDPHSSAAGRQLALLKYDQGDVVGANSELTHALTMNPHDSDAAKALIELWQNQVSRVPGANSHLGLARAYQVAGDLQSAQAEYRTVVQMDPNNPHLAAARQSFKLALARQEAQHNEDAAHTLESQGAVAAALEKMDEAVKLNPQDADMRVYQGYLLEKLGRFGEARQAYMTALKINPHNVLAAARIKGLPPAQLPAVWTPEAAASGLASGNPSNPLAYPPYQPVQHETSLNNISNFAFALRNQVLTQQTQMNQAADFTHDAMARMTGGAGSTDSLVTAGTSLSGINTNLALPQNDALSSSVASTLAQAKAAIAKAGGKPLPPSIAPGSSNMPPTAPPASTIANSQAPSQDAFKSEHPSLSNPYTNQPDVPENAAALALPYTPPVSTGTFGAANGATPNISGSPPVAPDWHQSPIASAVPPAVAPAFTTATAALPPIAPPGTAGQLPSLRGELPVAGSGVKFQLVGANPKAKGVDLNVVLLNDGDTPLILPRDVRAVIRYNGNRPDTEVKAVFASSAVAPHSSAQGTVHVPYDKADPTADLVLPQLLPPAFAQRDVHLVTSLAAR